MFLSLSHFTISYISCWYTVSGYPGENKLTLLTNPLLYFLIIKTNCFSNIMINKPIRNLDSSLNTHCVFHLCVPAATAAAAKLLEWGAIAFSVMCPYYVSKGGKICNYEGLPWWLRW